MDYLNIDERVIELNDKYERKIVEEFLIKQELSLEPDVEFCIAFLKENRIIAAGSFSGKILKCIAVAPEFQGLGILDKLVSGLISEEYRRGRTHLFVYTKPENYLMFKGLGFYKIAEVPFRVVLLENTSDGISQYLNELKKFKKDGKCISSLVVNCNPFTLGHQYVIENAAAHSDIVHIFVVWEDMSSFPAEIRYRLVREGTRHLPNVAVHRGKDYIISAATFPVYFLKKYSNIVEIQSNLDLKIFGGLIAPALGINKRFIGTEPYCQTTNTYNQVMKEILPQYGIEVVEVQRHAVEGQFVSASQVRDALRKNDFAEIKKIVPDTTYDFLISEEAKPIIEKIKTLQARH